MVVMLLGASMYAYIIGNIASLLSNLDSAKVNFRNRIEAVNQYLHYRHVPSELSTRVRHYYEYLWARRRGMKEEILLDDLPGPLRLDVLLHLTRKLLEKVPLFTYCSPTLRNVVLMALKSRTYAPGDCIAWEGELGKEIFFISRGKVAITSADGTKDHGTLEDGDYFGDLSLILGERRTASVRALTYCEIFVLTTNLESTDI
jgi:voltage-gated potassium channel